VKRRPKTRPKTQPKGDQFVQLVALAPRGHYCDPELYALTKDGRVYLHRGPNSNWAVGNWVRVPTLLVEPQPTQPMHATLDDVEKQLAWLEKHGKAES